MISNQILQNTIEGLKGITRIDLCVMDIDGKVLASTFSENGDYENAVLSFVASPADSQVIQGYQFFKIFDEHQLEYILLANGGNDDVYMIGKIAAFQIQNLLVAYKERFDKDNFIKNLLLDNLLLVDIYNRAKKLHIDTDVRRVIFIIETSHDKDTNTLDSVRSLFGGKTRDFITAVDEKNIIVVKELFAGEGYAEMEKVAEEMLSMLKSEGEEGAHIASARLWAISRKCQNHIKRQSLLWTSARFSLRRRTSLPTVRLASDGSFTSFRSRCARCLSVRFLKGSLRTTSMRRH